MENNKDIYYANCPHFTVGKVDQWFEQGYLFFEGNVYWYEEDRKDQCGTTNSPMLPQDFITYARKNNIAIPDDFMKTITT